MSTFLNKCNAFPKKKNKTWPNAAQLAMNIFPNLFRSTIRTCLAFCKRYFQHRDADY
jgi:hypothetical protein